MLNKIKQLAQGGGVKMEEDKQKLEKLENKTILANISDEYINIPENQLEIKPGDRLKVSSEDREEIVLQVSGSSKRFPDYIQTSFFVRRDSIMSVIREKRYEQKAGSSKGEFHKYFDKKYLSNSLADRFDFLPLEERLKSFGVEWRK